MKDHLIGYYFRLDATNLKGTDERQEIIRVPGLKLPREPEVTHAPGSLNLARSVDFLKNSLNRTVVSGHALQLLARAGLRVESTELIVHDYDSRAGRLHFDERSRPGEFALVDTPYLESKIDFLRSDKRPKNGAFPYVVLLEPDDQLPPFFLVGRSEFSCSAAVRDAIEGCVAGIREFVPWVVRRHAKTTALMLAVENGAASEVRLHRTENDIDARDAHGWSALHWAAERGDVEILAALLEANPDVCAETNHGYSALHIAAYHDNLEALEALMAADADPAATGRDGETTLHLAIRGGSTRCTRRLLSEAEEGGDSKQTLHELALAERQLEALKTLLELRPLETQGLQHLLHLAVRRYTPAVLPLAQAGADLTQLKAKEAPLHKAAQAADEELIDALVEAGFEVNAVAVGSTPLHRLLSWHGLAPTKLAEHAGVVRKLLRLGADPEIEDRRGRSSAQLMDEVIERASVDAPGAISTLRTLREEMSAVDA